ncbi:MAG TPA: tetratricopeptide repeat protein [Methylomirabilota bacterium]|nr:tetratricopeptide repeat protein [Methylomirabilota bacterium]
MGERLEQFAELVRLPEDALDLGLGALLIAQVEHPRLMPAHSLMHLDEMASASGAARVGDPLKALHRLREFLFEEEGFSGNAEDYYDPRNSCLNDVLERRVGIPITLSLVLMEVGRRVGLSIVGVGLPGHFVVRAEVGSDPVLLDPFDGGAVLTHERAAELVARATGRPVRLTEAHFAPATKQQMLGRMLMNLRGIYCRRGDWDKALAVFDRLLTLDERVVTHRRDRGTVLVKLGQLHQGAIDWGRYLEACPEAHDAENVRQQLRRVREQLAALN